MSGEGTSAACQECGYSLAGLAWSQTCCPECGLPVDLSSPFRRRPPPPMWTVLLRACWPTTALVLGAAVLMCLASTAGLIVLSAAWPILTLGWIMAAAMFPYEVARNFGELNILRPRREAVRRLMLVVMLAINIAQTVVITSVIAFV